MDLRDARGHVRKARQLLPQELVVGANDITGQFVQRQRRRILPAHLLPRFSFELFDDRLQRHAFARAGILKRQTALAAEIDLVFLKDARTTGPFRDQFTNRALFNRSSRCRINCRFVTHIQIKK